MPTPRATPNFTSRSTSRSTALRTLAAIAPTVLAAATCCAGLTYSNDQRFIRAQTSFGGNTIKQPPLALAPFNDNAAADSTLPTGTCQGFSFQASALAPTGITASGEASPSAAATDSSGLLFAASGASVLKVSFTPDADGILDLQGQFTSNGSGNTSADFVLRLDAQASTLVSSTTGGPFDVSSLVFAGVTYTLEVSAAANAFAFYLVAPVASNANAAFTLSATTRAATCPGDLNADGFVDDADFSVFAVAYNLLDCADPAMLPGCPADLNSDSVVDDTDFTIFAPAYDALLCE